MEPIQTTQIIHGNITLKFCPFDPKKQEWFLVSKKEEAKDE